MRTAFFLLTVIGLFFWPCFAGAQSAPCTKVGISAGPFGDQVICAGSSGTLSVTATGTSTVYQWQYSPDNATWISVAGDPTMSGGNTAVLTISSTVGEANAYYYRCVLSNFCSGPLASSSVQVTIKPKVVPTISIDVPTLTCTSTGIGSGNFSVSATNVGVMPYYTWFVNGLSYLTSGNTFTIGVPPGTYSVFCIVQADAGACAVPYNLGSNTVYWTVASNVTPGMNVTASAAEVCSGSPVTFTAAGSNGGTAPTYNWTVNGNSVGTASTFVSNSLVSTDVVKCDMTSNAVCATPATVTAPAPAVTVDHTYHPTVTITASANPICAGTPVTFTAVGSDVGTGENYSWSFGGTYVGSGTTYTSPNLFNGAKIQCAVKVAELCTTVNPALSNTITMQVTQPVDVGVSVATSTASVCSGAPVTFTASSTNGGASPVYAWTVNGAAVGSDAPTFTTTALGNGDIVSCKLTSDDVCASVSSVSASAPAVTVNAVTHPAIGIEASSTSICSGVPVTFTATVTDAGSNPTYSWMVDGVASGSSSTFSSSTLVDGAKVQCEVKCMDLCAVNPGVSNTITESVTATPVVELSIAASSTSVCAGAPVTFTASSTNGGSAPVYEWLVNGGAAGASGVSFTSSSLGNGDMVSCRLTSSLSCTSTVSSDNTVAMTVNPVPVLTMMADTLIAAGGSVVLHALTDVAVGFWQWTPAFSLDDGASATPVASPLETTTYGLVVTTSAGCKASGTVTVDVFHQLQMPTAFTPNGDGRNDVFRVPPSMGVVIRQLAIFDRWGNRVFMTQDSGAGWDGRTGGQVQPAGVYVWGVEWQDQVTQQWRKSSGTVVLVR